MNRYLYLLLCSHIVLTTSAEPPVCIVGAGASGLSAAHALEALGRRTVIFEEKGEVGGNAQNYYENNQPFYLGPLLIGNSSHPETMKIVEAVDVPVTTYTPESRWIFNWTTGETWPAPETPQTPPPEFLEELQRYTVQWQRVYGRFAGLAITENVPAELTVSTTEWFTEQKLPLLHATIMPSLIAWGYGTVDELPIFYSLSIFTPAALTGTRLRVDFHEVFQRWSRQLTRSEIRLGSKAERIDRSEETITLYYTSSQKQNEPLQQGCSDLILAFPPTLPSLEAAGQILSPAEEAVFSAVRTTNYFSAAVRLDTPPLSFFRIATETLYSSPEIAGQPVSVEGQYNISDISLLYALASHSQSVEAVAAVTLQTLSRINGDPTDDDGPTTPVTAGDIKAFRHHPYYFPHFGREALRGGLYDLFNDLQGANRTYFTSGLNRVEHVEYVVLSAREVVQRYFSG